MFLYFSLLVCIVGAVIYVAAKDGKLQEIGRIAYAMGLLAFLLTAIGTKGVGLGR